LSGPSGRVFIHRTNHNFQATCGPRGALSLVAKFSAPFSSLLSPFEAFPETEISYLNQASPVNRGKKDVQLCLNKLVWK
jgi:hypothetical protein